ncbi:MAG: LysR family transcriptional regulator, partial [Bradyrhizobiaceae bacterium]
ILKGWKQPEGAVHLVMPPGGPRPARVEALIEFLAIHLARLGKAATAKSRREPEAG